MLNFGPDWQVTKVEVDDASSILMDIPDQLILKPMIDELCENLFKKYNISFSVKEDAESFIAQKGYSPEYGVRELHRVFYDLVESPAAELLNKGVMRGSEIWEVEVQDQSLLFKCENRTIS